jgi:hypothetical protein
MQAFYTFLGGNDMMAYLTMMSSRLVELRRVLKPTASHYLKLLCDAILGKDNFRNEFIWKRTTSHVDAKRGGNVHDSILFYSKTDDYVWNKLFQTYDADYVENYYRYEEPDGRKFMSADLSGAGSGPARKFGDRGEIPAPSGRHWMYDQAGIDRVMKEGKIYWTRNGIPRLKVYLDEAPGMPLNDLWTDVQALRSWHQERLGYPTQKPVALLERIILASSNPGGLVLDPFCGCGTTIDAAEKNGRDWIGIDVTQLAISLIKNRLQDTYGPRLKFVSGTAPHSSPSPPPKEERAGERRPIVSESAIRNPQSAVDQSLVTSAATEMGSRASTVRVIGEPTTPNEAATLAEDDKYQFQWWALGLVGARPVEQKKGADHGVDGKILFRDDPKAAKPEQIIIQVKGGKTGVKDVRDLRGVLDRERAAIGILISLQPATGPMETEAASAGFYEHKTNRQKYPRLQLRTVKELMEGKGIERPSTVAATDETFKKAPESKKKHGEQKALEL